MNQKPHRAAGLRRELRIWEALALSIGLMSPALAMSASGAGAAAIAGRAAPLAFVFSGVAVALVGFGFIYLSRYFSHAGSVYAFTGATLGPKAGFFSGWALLGTYSVFTPASLIACGGFGAQFLSGTGIWPHASYLVLALIGGVAVWLFTAGDIRALTRGLLTMEGISVALILLLMIVVFAKLAGHSGPGHLGLSAKVFAPANGVGVHAITLGAIFGFIAFAGFEGAASLGEETIDPRRNIPRALSVAVAGAVIFYVLCMTMQSMAFGTTSAGVGRFANSSGPLFEIAGSYFSSTVGHALELGAAVSAFGSALGSAAGGSRLLFALTRDAAPNSRLTRVTDRSGTPAFALALLMLFSFAITVAIGILGTASLTAWGYLGTIGVLSLLVAYLMVNVGAGLHMIRNRELERRWQIVLPIAAVLVLGYTLYNQLLPVPPSPFNVFPYVVAGWLLLGIAIVVAAPGAAERVGTGLALREGLAPDTAGGASKASDAASDPAAA